MRGFSVILGVYPQNDRKPPFRPLFDPFLGCFGGFPGALFVKSPKTRLKRGQKGVEKGSKTPFWPLFDPYTPIYGFSGVKMGPFWRVKKGSKKGQKRGPKMTLFWSLFGPQKRLKNTLFKGYMCKCVFSPSALGHYTHLVNRGKKGVFGGIQKWLFFDHFLDIQNDHFHVIVLDMSIWTCQFGHATMVLALTYAVCMLVLVPL